MSFKRNSSLNKIIIGAVIASLMLGLFALASCAPRETEAEKAAKANREYMSAVNQIMDEIAGELTVFSGELRDEDLVGMSSCLANVTRQINALGALTAPEALKAIGNDYKEGCELLKQALQAYVDLYTEINAAGSSYDYSQYNTRITHIQNIYDDGLEKLADADKAASELK